MAYAFNQEYDRLFKELDERIGTSIAKYKQLVGGKAEYYRGKIELTGIEEMLFELSEGDLTKTVILSKLNVKKIYTYIYLKRVNYLNMLLESMARL